MKKTVILIIMLTFEFTVSSPTPAALVITQDVSRASEGQHLLNLSGQQDVAHTQVYNNHNVSSVHPFTINNLTGIDIVYLSPCSGKFGGQLNLSLNEIDALESFVYKGGRLILAVDNSWGQWDSHFVSIAARFGTTYIGGDSSDGVVSVVNFSNRITNGPAGKIHSFSVHRSNRGLISSNPDFLSLASNIDGNSALGYLPPNPNLGRLGEVVFLTDFNTFDTVGFNGVNLYALDNQILWTNMFIPIPEPATVVAVDIKPGSCPNPVNVKSSGVLPIAILGTDDYDVTTIDPTSIRLAGVEPLRSGYEDVAGPVSDTNDCNCITDGPDGFLDLTLKFKTQRIVEAIGDVNDGDVRVLTLTGVLFDPMPFETPIEGADCILIRGRHKPINPADINKDGVVNAADFAIFAQNWLQSSIVDE